MGDEPICMKPASPEQVLFAEALQCATPEARAAYHRDENEFAD